MKTTMSIADVARRLTEIVPNARDLTPIVEGEESQAFAFCDDDGRWVLRIGPSLAGYQKDAYASEHYATGTLPIPDVRGVGMFDADHAWIISEMMPGITLQDTDDATVRRAMPAVIAVWEAIGSRPVGRGAGPIDTAGNAHWRNWQTWLGSILESPDLRHPLLDQSLVDEMTAEFTRLIPCCPNESRLVHGDFGSNNLLIDPETAQVTAVIDWENALIGDPLLDLTAHFWRTHLRCMDISAAYTDAHLGHLPEYGERIRCYQLWIGLNELIDNARDGDTDMLAWLHRRCRQILSESSW